jgi:PAS domain S-box-containing protein
MQDGFAFHKVLFDENGRPEDYVFLEINEAFEQLTGLKKENVIGKKVTEVLPGIERDPADWLGIYGKVALTGKPVRFESYADSLGKWFKVSAYSAEKGYFAVAFEDITERKKAEEENEAQRALLERVMAGLPAGVNLVRGEDLRYILVNPGYSAIAPGKEMLGKTIGEVWPEVHGLEEIYHRVLSTGEPHHSLDERFEIRRSPAGDLETAYFSWSLFRVRLPGKDGWGVLNTVWETTERKKSEDTLRVLNKRFEMAQQAAGAGVWDWNIKTGHIEWTAEMFRLFGLDTQKDKASFEVWQAILHPEDREKAASKIDEALKSRSFLDNEYRLVRPNGQVVWINALGHAEYDNQNQPVRMTGICIDITERKRAEEVLLEQSLAIGSAPDAVFSTDASFVIKSWNRAAERIFGWKAEEAIGKAGFSFLKPVYPTLNGLSRERIIEQLHGLGSWHGELIMHKKDGSSFPVSVSSSVIKDKEGGFVGSVSVVHDISARKKREEALKEAQRDLNRAQAVAKTGSWRLDTQQDVLVWSDENHRIFGVPKGTPMTYESFLELVHPGDREYLDRKWKDALRGEPYDIEHRIIVDGKVHWVREKAELEFDANGVLLGGFGATQDITDMAEMRAKLEFYSRHLEELVEEKTKELKVAERMATIGQTAGMVGHDIRNPLQAIVGDVYLAKEELKSLPDSEEKCSLQESMDEISKNTEYISKIIADLQDFAKPLSPFFEETDLKMIVDDVMRNNVLPDNVHSEVNVEEEASMVKADAAYLKRIVGNLVVNAVQAMPKGGKLRLSVYKEGRDAVIAVEDSGVGIPETVRSRLFTPLFTTKSRGQGFGLAVVKRLTEALKGNVSFESEMGKGTKFIVRLPQLDKQQSA